MTNIRKIFNETVSIGIGVTIGLQGFVGGTTVTAAVFNLAGLTAGLGSVVGGIVVAYWAARIGYAGAKVLLEASAAPLKPQQRCYQS